MNFRSCIDELEKLGVVDPEEARRSLDRLEAIEKTKPTLGQAGRYGALGAAAGALTRSISHGIEHGKLPAKGSLLGASAAGALGMGAVPLARSMLDRHAEMGTLKNFMKEQETKTADSLPDWVSPNSGGFSVSRYSGPLSYGRFPLVSKLPPFTAPPLTSTFQKKQAGIMAANGITPQAKLTSGQRIGLPKVTAPSGPSIGDYSKPTGYGTKIPGASKSL